MTQICVVSSLLSAMTLAAAIDSGSLPGTPGADRILLVSNNAVAPELVAPWHETRSGAPLLTRFARVIYLNELLYPYLPTTWEPRDEDVPMLERLLRSCWSLEDDPIELVVESVDTPPASAIVQVFRQAPITVLSAGLECYGPSRPGLALHVSQRLRTHVYLDVLSGVVPVLLSEHRVPLVRVSADSLGSVLKEIAMGGAPDPAPDSGDKPTSLVLGQRFSDLELLDLAEELQLYVEMLGAALGHGAERVLFKPHPSSSPALAEALRCRARSSGIELLVLDPSVPAELVASTGALDWVVSCSSTALVTASNMFGVPAISIGPAMLLGRLTPYQDRNRIPLTIVDALTRPGEPYRDPARMQQLLDTVSFCMQPGTASHLRTSAEAFLAGVPDSERRRYVNLKRLRALGLPAMDDAGARGASVAASSGWKRPIAAAQRRLRKFASGFSGDRAE